MPYNQTLQQRISDFIKNEKHLASEDCNNWIYFFYNPATKMVKIGITNTGVWNRKRQLERQSGCELYIALAVNLQPSIDPSAISIERFLHKELKKYRSINGEWFNMLPITFCRIYESLSKIGDDLIDECREIRYLHEEA